MSYASVEELSKDPSEEIVEPPEQHAFEFSPFGILPPGEAQRILNGSKAPDMAPSVVRAPPERKVQSPARSAVGRFVLDPGKPLNGADLVKLAKDRIREIDRALKSVPALERERAQLKALVVAASQQPRRRRRASDEGIQ